MLREQTKRPFYNYILCKRAFLCDTMCNFGARKRMLINNLLWICLKMRNTKDFIITNI